MLGKEKFCLKWNEYQENIVSGFKDLRHDKEFTDVTLACGDGQLAEAHITVLTTFSPLFKSLLKTKKLQHPLHPSPNVPSQSRILAPKWVTHHFWEINICGAAPLSINATLLIYEGLVAARTTLCAVVNTSHPHIPETHQESCMKAFVG